MNIFFDLAGECLSGRFFGFLRQSVTAGEFYANPAYLGAVNRKIFYLKSSCFNFSKFFLDIYLESVIQCRMSILWVGLRKNQSYNDTAIIFSLNVSISTEYTLKKNLNSKG